MNDTMKKVISEIINHVFTDMRKSNPELPEVDSSDFKLVEIKPGFYVLPVYRTLEDENTLLVCIFHVKILSDTKFEISLATPYDEGIVGTINNEMSIETLNKE